MVFICHDCPIFDILCYKNCGNFTTLLISVHYLAHPQKLQQCHCPFRYDVRIPELDMLSDWSELAGHGNCASLYGIRKVSVDFLWCPDQPEEWGEVNTAGLLTFSSRQKVSVQIVPTELSMFLSFAKIFFPISGQKFLQVNTNSNCMVTTEFKSLPSISFFSGMWFSFFFLI